jgi:trimeric autotransporter adhesin
MKKLQLLLIAFLLTSAVFAQSPNMINYQGVALNASGTAIANQTIAIRTSVHQATTNGTIVYSEERSVATDAGGLFNFAIGSSGTSATTGSWAAINWDNGNKFLEIEMDAAGGTNFISMGIQQLVSVPYAQYANKAGSLIPTATINPNQINAGGATTNQVLKYNGTNWVPGADVSAFAIPYAATDASATSSFAITNSSSTFGVGIKGISSGNGTTARGVWGEGTGTNGIGVYGTSSQSDAIVGSSTGGHGVRGTTTSASEFGVYGLHTTGIAIKGQTTTGYGIMGEATGGSGRGVFGISNGASGRGISGESVSGTGVHGYGNNAGSYGLFGSSLSGTGVYATSFTGNALDVNGNLKIAGGNTNPSAGAVLTSDATGNATWKTNKVAFKASSAANAQTIPISTWTNVTNFSQIFDAGSNFNPHSAVTDPNTFIAPVTGYYQFNAHAQFQLSSTVNNILYTEARFTINGAAFGSHNGYGTWNASVTSWGSVNCTESFLLNAGDKVKIQLSQNSEGSSSVIINSVQFEGHLIFVN